MAVRALRAAPDEAMPARPVVVGVAEHAGWAFLISAAAVNDRPAVIDKRRVSLIENDLPTQPYHHETLTLRDDEAEQLLRKVRRSIAASTGQALDRLAHDLQPAYRVYTLAMRQPTLDRMPATVQEAHGSYHVQCRADAMLYHSAICEAARDRDWSVVFHRRGEELQRAAGGLRTSTDDVERWLNDLRTTVKPPWAAEHRHAFAAAIGALSEQSRLHRA